uniref:serine hydrolase-like protein n=1 Tax=Ciona intestinalis TaxID=7719 RepID=UPI000EF47DD6|nr:serine hydrolase-like protein [Ciona intestinalis]|eukprot:XP_002130064.2 serine hydrolase-like protein [Ciona intestinalis]
MDSKQDGPSYICTTKRGISREIKIPINVGILCGRAFGNPKDPPVLCLHGWQDNCNTFEKLIPLLPKNHYYVAMDMIGHGHSVSLPPGVFYSVYSYVSMIYGIAQYMGWKSFIALGHSLGGSTVAFFAAVFPKMVEKIILLDSIGIAGFQNSQNLEIIDLQRVGIEHHLDVEGKVSYPVYTFNEAKSRLQASNKALDDEAANILLERGLSKEKDGKYKIRRDVRVVKVHIHYKEVEDALVFTKKANMPIYHILPENGLKKSVGVDRMHKEMGLFERPNHVFIKVKGNHFVHLLEPEIVANEVTKILNQDFHIAPKM